MASTVALFALASAVASVVPRRALASAVAVGAIPAAAVPVASHASDASASPVTLVPQSGQSGSAPPVAVEAAKDILAVLVDLRVMLIMVKAQAVLEI